MNLEVLEERTTTPELTIVKGIYNSKPFKMYYYEFQNTGTIDGDFTEKEIDDIFNCWLCSVN